MVTELLGGGFMVQLTVDREIVTGDAANLARGDREQAASVVGQFGGNGRERLVEGLDKADLGSGLGIFRNARIGFSRRRGGELERIVGRLDLDHLPGHLTRGVGDVDHQIVDAAGAFEIERVFQDDTDRAIAIGLQREVIVVVALTGGQGVGKRAAARSGRRQRAHHRADAGGFRNGRAGKRNAGGRVVDIGDVDREALDHFAAIAVRNLDRDIVRGRGFVIQRAFDDQLPCAVVVDHGEPAASIVLKRIGQRVSVRIGRREDADNRVAGGVLGDGITGKGKTGRGGIETERRGKHGQRVVDQRDPCHDDLVSGKQDGIGRRRRRACRR